MDVAVIGGGYVGLVQAAGMARLGHRVRVGEVNQSKLAELEAGRLPIYEAGLDDLMEHATAAGTVFEGLRILNGNAPGTTGAPDTTEAGEAVTTTTRERALHALPQRDLEPRVLTHDRADVDARLVARESELRVSRLVAVDADRRVAVDLVHDADDEHERAAAEQEAGNDID